MTISKAQVFCSLSADYNMCQVRVMPNYLPALLCTTLMSVHSSRVTDQYVDLLSMLGASPLAGDANLSPLQLDQLTNLKQDLCQQI